MERRIAETLRRSDTLFRAGDVEQAQRLVASAYQTSPDEVEVLRRLAFYAIRRGQSVEALTALQRAADVSSSATDLHALAKGAWQLGRYGEAISTFGQLVEKVPGDVAYRVALAQAHLSLAQIQEARSVLDEIDDESGTPALRMLKALFAFDSKAVPRFSKLVLAADLDLAQSPIAAGLIYLSERLSGHRGPSDEVNYALMSVQREAVEFAISKITADRLVQFPVEVLLAAIDCADSSLPAVECGVFRGRSLRLIADRWQGEVHGFDSFEGLPEDWTKNEHKGAYTTRGERPSVAGHVTLHAGWFHETLPLFAKELGARQIGLLHVDCDIYSATRTVLQELDVALQPGSVIVFDDLLGYKGYRDHELRAWEEFAQRRDLRYEWLACSLIPREVALKIL